MQIIFLLLELFLPEIARQLSGDAAGTLRKRLFRSGIGILVLALLIFCWTLFSHVFVQRLPVNQFNPFDFSIFTAWILVMSGLGLFMLSRYESPQKIGVTVERTANTSSMEAPLSLSCNQTIPDSHYGIVKTKTIEWRDFLSGAVPDEEWGFFIAEQYCKVVNNSVLGSKLYVNSSLVAQNPTPTRFGRCKHAGLQATICDTAGTKYEVAIFFRAWLHIKIRVAINGKHLSENFV